jgi:hypothetical protein
LKKSITIKDWWSGSSIKRACFKHEALSLNPSTTKKKKKAMIDSEK